MRDIYRYISRSAVMAVWEHQPEIKLNVEYPKWNWEDKNYWLEIKNVDGIIPHDLIEYANYDCSNIECLHDGQWKRFKGDKTTLALNIVVDLKLGNGFNYKLSKARQSEFKSAVINSDGQGKFIGTVLTYAETHEIKGDLKSVLNSLLEMIESYE